MTTMKSTDRRASAHRHRRAAALCLLTLLAVVVAACALAPQATPSAVPLPPSPTAPPQITPPQPTPTLSTAPTAPATVLPATATAIPSTATRVLPSPSATPPPATATLAPTAAPVPPTFTPGGPASATQPPSLTPPPTATAVAFPRDPICFASTGRLNLYAGPDPSYDVVVTLGINEEVRPIARTADSRWLQVVTLDGLQGWLAADLSHCQYLDLGRLLVVNAPATATPVPTPTAPPAPTPVVIRDWRGEYFNRIDLAGSPALVRNDVTLSFTWGDGAPAPGLPADAFSARWTRTVEFGAGTYRFNLSADDGARLFIDDMLVLDMWELGSARTRSVVLGLAGGPRRLRVEYFENTGTALCSFWWETAAFAGWRGEYYANPSLSGSPALVRDDPNVNFVWGQGSPAPGIPADNFSARWTRDVNFEGGVYRLAVTVDDGVRIWLDGQIIVDEWRPANATYARDLTVTPGVHNVRVEYFEATGEARLTWTWDRAADVYPNYRGEYFNNDALIGAPLFMRNDTVLDFIWGTGAPDARLNPASFSARWTGRPVIGQGLHLLRAESDDGVRVWIDGGLVIDAWRQGAVAEAVNVMISGGGRHDVRVEYFQRGGTARVHVWWLPVSGLVAQ